MNETYKKPPITHREAAAAVKTGHNSAQRLKLFAVLGSGQVYFSYKARRFNTMIYHFFCSRAEVAIRRSAVCVTYTLDSFFIPARCHLVCLCTPI